MKRIKLLCTAVAVLMGCTLALAQDIRVTGTVSSPEGEPLPGAAVILEGTTRGVHTDLDGTFSIDAPANGALIISTIGFKTLTVPLNGRSRLAVVLDEDSELLTETIVTAYGTSTKGTYTGSASVVKADQIEKRQVSDITHALSGAVAGVQIQSANGQPGVAATIRVRGVGSINAGTSPLILVDGMPVGDLSALNSDDIESMTVLKDAASTSLYGARGANGIIMITTKKGKSSEALINVDAKVGVNSRMIKTYDVLTDPGEYMEKVYQALYNTAYYNIASSAGNAEAANAYANARIFLKGSGIGYQIYTLPDGASLFGLDGKINPAATLGYSDGDYYYTPDNWQNETFSSNIRQEYNINVSASKDRLNYYASAGYLQDEGVITNSGFTRLTGRLKADYQVKDWLKVGGNFAYTNTKSRYPDEQVTTNSSGNAFFLANYLAPVYPIYVRDPQGNIVMDGSNKVYDYGDGVVTHGNRSWMSIANPIGDLTYNTEEYLYDIMNLNWFAELKPIKGLTLTARWGTDITNRRYNYLGNPFYGQSASCHGTVYQSGSRYGRFDQQYIADYTFTLGAFHDFDITAGYDGYKYDYYYVSGSGQNIYNPYSFYVSNSIDQRRSYGGGDHYATQGFFAQLNYSYDQKYIASVSFRRDASSRFAPEHRWGNFFSASAAWLITREKFMQDIHWVDMLKLKASIGQQGNDSIGNYYAYMDQYELSGSDGVFSDGKLIYKGNPDLTWETSTSYNAGIDFSLFGDKLSGTIEYFGRESDNMLYNKPVASSNGFSSIPMNVGSMRNSGLEVELSYDVIRTKNVTWNLNGNASFIRNKIIKLHPDLEGDLIDGSRIYKEGESMYQFYLVEYAGVDPENGMALYYTEDDNGDKTTTTDWSDAYAHRKASGDLLPKVYGGFGTNLSAYGFDFSVQFAYQLGGKIYDSGYASLMHGATTSTVGENWHVDIRKSWTPDNTDTDVPRVNQTDRYASSSSDRWLISSNYLTLNNITLGYTLPEKVTRKIGISKLRIFGVADNVAILTARKGLDPRQSYTTSTTARYTPIRTISGGISLTF